MADNKNQEQEKRPGESLPETVQEETNRDISSEHPAGSPEKETMVFQLKDIDYDQAYEEIKKKNVTVSDEETKKKIQQARESTVLEEKQQEKIKRKNKTRWLRALLFTLGIIALSLTLAWIVMVGVRDIMGMEVEEYRTVVVKIEDGQSADEIAELLGEKGIISYPWLFKVVIKLDGIGGTFHFGRHTFNPHASYAEIVAELQQVPVQESVKVVIPEGYNLVEIARALEKKEICTADDFIEAVNTVKFDYSFIKELEEDSDPLVFYPLEGYLFPDTYDLLVDMEPEAAARKFLDNFEKKIEPYRELMSQRGMTLRETITLASIIQSESANNEQMALISSVLHNRLNNQGACPHLEVDPARKYVEEVIQPNIETERQDIYDAYDTRVKVGLPVGPICSPGEAAIKAALQPKSSNYYFFVHNVETGECLFAVTYAKHQENCQALGITDY